MERGGRARIDIERKLDGRVAGSELCGHQHVIDRDASVVLLIGDLDPHGIAREAPAD